MAYNSPQSATYNHIIVTDMEGNIRIYRDCPRVMVRTSGNDIAQAGGEGNISFTVRTTTKGQSVYPDIAIHISNYCVYCIEYQKSDTHNINVQKLFKESRNLIGTAILYADIDRSKNRA